MSASGRRHRDTSKPAGRLTPLRSNINAHSRPDRSLKLLLRPIGTKGRDIGLTASETAVTHAEDTALFARGVDAVPLTLIAASVSACANHLWFAGTNSTCH
jgi:hypothetical protein